MDIKSIHQRISELCRQKNWSYYRLAKKSGFQQSTLKSIIKEKNMPTLYTLDKICKALDISLSDFFNSNLFNTSTSTSLHSELWNSLEPKDKEKVIIYTYGLLHKIPKEKKEI